MSRISKLSWSSPKEDLSWSAMLPPLSEAPSSIRVLICHPLEVVTTIIVSSESSDLSIELNCPLTRESESPIQPCSISISPYSTCGPFGPTLSKITWIPLSDSTVPIPASPLAEILVSKSSMVLKLESVTYATSSESWGVPSLQIETSTSISSCSMTVNSGSAASSPTALL